MALAPVPAPIGIHPSFIATRPETIVLKEKVFSLTGDDFHIKLANGTPILRVAGKVFSISGRKKVYDMAGNWLFDIIKERLHIHSTYKVISGGAGNAQQELMVVKSSFKLFGSKATARFTSLNGKSEALSMRGNWWDTSADILDEAQGSMFIFLFFFLFLFLSPLLTYFPFPPCSTPTKQQQQYF